DKLLQLGGVRFRSIRRSQIDVVAERGVGLEYSTIFPVLAAQERQRESGILQERARFHELRRGSRIEEELRLGLLGFADRFREFRFALVDARRGYQSALLGELLTECLRQGRALGTSAI